ncbi:MAG: hypothetical protein FWF44_08500, partial [Defluviitaleaceae bacterium]|nr:hypothetical protein [Defluviitaleaceae bacterium]
TALNSGAASGMLRVPPSNVFYTRTAPKVFMSNDCAFNCSYCGCRKRRDDRARYTNEPKDFAKMSYDVAAANGGSVFVTSAVYKTPDNTEERIIETMRILRREMNYKGYLHAKIMPGCGPELIRQAGLYANRLSVNIEVARSEGYKAIARDKNKTNILGPMARISELIQEYKKGAGGYGRRFATSQTTQLMAGSTGEDDFTILNLSQAMYGKYRLSRVYYTAYHNDGRAEGYDGLPDVSTPGWRMTRLYQADRLMQLYGFSPRDIAPAEAPNLTSDFDPKAAWALRNLDMFPIEVNIADYDTLLRIPGIGVTYAKRIIEARRTCTVTHDVLAKLGVSLKRGRHFLTAGGKYDGARADDPDVYARLLRSPLGPDAILSGAQRRSSPCE